MKLNIKFPARRQIKLTDEICLKFNEQVDNIKKDYFNDETWFLGAMCYNQLVLEIFMRKTKEIIKELSDKNYKLYDYDYE